MPDPAPSDVTVLLVDLSTDVAGAADRPVSVVMDELHRIADQAMRREADGHTRQPTELVDEAMMRRRVRATQWPSGEAKGGTCRTAVGVLAWRHPHDGRP